MYTDQKKKRLPQILLCAVVVLAAVVFGPAAVRNAGSDINGESAQALKEAIRRCARQCYVVEGIYPPDLAYLEENYGLQVNTEDFYISYDAFASNLPPDIRVTEKE